MEHISIDKLHELLPELGEDDLILDVRSPGEFAEGHIKNAQNHDHESVGEISEELKKYKKVYVHCKMGGRAQYASDILESSGLKNIVCVSQGGMHRWMEMGWEVE
ncbi:MAG: rhodanese-like domain-containing protein [Nitrospinaceae bacterium]|nr:rhodanese-like domain-containing protein [Nitrospinaceae bacterium]